MIRYDHDPRRLAALATLLLAACVRGAPPSTPPVDRPEARPPAPAASSASPPAREAAPARYLHRFEALRGRGDGAHLFDVLARSAPDDGVVALLGYDGALSIDGRQLDGGYHDFAVVRLDASGRVEWVFSLPPAVEDVARRRGRYANALHVADDGSIFVGGVFQDRGPGFTIMRLSPQGRLIWATSPRPGETWSEAHDVTLDARGRVVAVGHFSEALALEGLEGLRCSRSCGFAVALDAEDGRPLWLAGLQTRDGALVEVEPTGYGDVVVAGHFSRAAALGEHRVRGDRTLDLVVARLDGAGAPRWVVRQGTERRDELLDMVALDGDRVALGTSTELLVVSAGDGSVSWRRALAEGQRLVSSQRPRSRPWIVSTRVDSEGITRVLLDVFDESGTARRASELRTVVYGLSDRPRLTLGRTALLLGGALRDNRWDARPASPFLARVPLADVSPGVALEGLPLRGARSRSRCPAEQRRRPERPDALELRAGLERVLPDVEACGVTPRALPVTLDIGGDGRVRHAEVDAPLSTRRAECVTAALRGARFCPFRGEAFHIETALP